MTPATTLHDAAAFADELDKVLKRHVIDAWFPRSIDHEHGGFLCDFDRQWNSASVPGPGSDGRAHDKLIEFPARHTLFAAEAALAFPADEPLRAAAVHGFKYLREAMWDHDAGGWYHRLDRAGKPLEGGTKHTHGIAYAIQACVAVYALTKDPDALKLAHDALAWIDRHARDPEHGGYFGFMDRSGSLIREAGDTRWPHSDLDTIGTPLGFKDANVHSDLLEALTAFARVDTSAQVRGRLTELAALFIDRLIGPNGALTFYSAPDWTPVPHLVRFGTAFQTSWRLPAAVAALGGDTRAGDAAAQRLVRHAQRYGADEREGGFVFAGPGVSPLDLWGAHELRVRLKDWWVQFEAFRALLEQQHRAPADGSDAEAAARQWRYLVDHLIDDEHGGIYYTAGGLLAKGTEWKDASHDGRALLACSLLLRRGTRGPT